jgi:hypothetical protein
MSLGSGLFSAARAAFAHIIKPGPGVAGEIYDLRKDLNNAFAPMAAIAVEEFTTPPGSAALATNSLLAATATVAAPVTVLKAALVAAGLAQLALWPRQLTFTTAGGTAADAPATVAITGLDAFGAAQTETLALAQTAATVTSVKFWSDITSLVYPAADGTGATVAVGAAAAVLKGATATVAAPVTVLGTTLIQTDLANNPRQLVFTTAGGTAADAPANVVITGLDPQGKVITETLVLAQTATTATSVNAYSSVTSLAYPAADGTGATIAVSFGAVIGLKRPVKSRTGAVVPIQHELMDGTAPTAGALSAPATVGPYGGYTPNTAVNGVHKYAIYYEYDASLTS